MSISCDSCSRFTNNPEDKKYVCDLIDCPARQKIPELVVKCYLSRIKEYEFNTNKITVLIDNKKYKLKEV